MMHRTCNVMIVSAALIAGLLGGSVASAATIVGSKHDFSVSNTTGSTPFAGAFYTMQGGFPLYIDEVCVFCHTPHSASTDAQTSQWLWNRVSTPRAGDSYQMYTSATVSTGAMAGPTGVSMMCMSCHDGVTSIAVNTLKNAPGGANPADVQVDTFMMPSPGAKRPRARFQTSSTWARFLPSPPWSSPSSSSSPRATTSPTPAAWSPGRATP